MKEEVNDLKHSFRPLSTSSIKSIGAVTFSGGTDVVKWIGTPLSFINNAWSGSCILKKTITAQAQDFAMMFRLITSAGDRFTLSIRTGGYLNLRLRNADGTIQRELQTTGVPSLSDYVTCYYSWNPTLSVLNFVCKYGSNKEELTTNSLVSLLPYTGETTGLYFGNSYTGTYPYKGKIYGGTFAYRYNTLDELSHLCDNEYLVPGTSFVSIPQLFGLVNTTTVREPNNHPLTVSVSNLSIFWTK